MYLVYLAGAYTAEHAYQVKKNIIKADLLSLKLCLAGLDVFPVCPHKNTEHFEGAREDKYFIEGTKELMRRCDALLIIPGSEESKGTIGEIEEAHRLGKPVFYSIEDLSTWSVGLRGDEPIAHAC